MILAQIWSPQKIFKGFTTDRCYNLLQATIACNFNEN